MTSLHASRSTYRAGSPEERFWSKVDPCRTDGCALWVGAINRGGYGAFWMGLKTTAAHHFLVGKPPKGLVWDHVKSRGCTHRHCVWPDHLELVTQGENMRRGDHWQRRKTHCPQGHEYSPENTYRYGNQRDCRACRLAKRTSKGETT